MCSGNGPHEQRYEIRSFGGAAAFICSNAVQSTASTFAAWNFRRSLSALSGEATPTLSSSVVEFRTGAMDARRSRASMPLADAGAGGEATNKKQSSTPKVLKTTL